ncbi:hypothetical protein PAXINDRAFT_172637 [Paxillus involutus ATCC 200175]|uniref:Protein kinase domain-containing protein n=1 Tax=Paxillus involutus ATCC 200175 TaxID=664439 RepID=A0A0C9TPI4_PAXIN|nr:hypothetical protein PAXINDRAFT_172637 [Paxillus involutus ATCC 200175]
MAEINQSSQPYDRPRNIVFFGQEGVGKSSIINLIVGHSVAKTGDDVRACTLVNACYPTTIHGEIFNLWDTRGLSGEAFDDLPGGDSKQQLKKFLRERHQQREIDLLIYCVLVKDYNTFCLPTRRLAAPVVIVVTHLEREKNMEDWWNRNEYSLQRREMEFDGHACITAIPNHPQENMSKTTLHDLIARNYHWQAECDGSYFGSPASWAHSNAHSGAVRPRMDTTRSEARSEARSSPGTWLYGKRFYGLFWGKATPNRDAITRPTSPTTRGTALSQPLCEESDSTTSHFHLMIRASSGASCPSRSDSHPHQLVEDHGVSHKDLTAVVNRRKQYPMGNGSFGDIWQCDLMMGQTPRMVAVKAVRTQMTDPQHLATQEKKLRHELKVWDELQHINIVELLGVVSDFGVLPSMVSPWFSNGSLSSYLSKHEAMGLSARLGLLFDIASGLRYLHSQSVVHGALHGHNVLVDENGRACLTDFGLSVILQDFPGTSYLKSGVCGALRYADPELVRRVHVDLQVVYPTKPSDVYSFGGLTLYVLTGKQPYEGIGAFLLSTTILRGDRPPLPVSISPQFKSLIQRCWSPKESTRPSAEDIITSLQV